MSFDDRQKRRPWGEDGRIDPDEIGREDEEESAGPDAPSRGLVTRALSVVPFLLVAALGLIGVVGWLIIVLFGVGTGNPVWKAVQGLSPAQVLWQLLLVVIIGAVPVLFTLAGSWATCARFQRELGSHLLGSDRGAVGYCGSGARGDRPGAARVADPPRTLGPRLVVPVRHGSVRDDHGRRAPARGARVGPAEVAEDVSDARRTEGRRGRRPPGAAALAGGRRRSAARAGRRGAAHAVPARARRRRGARGHRAAARGDPRRRRVVRRGGGGPHAGRPRARGSRGCWTRR